MPQLPTEQIKALERVAAARKRGDREAARRHARKAEALTKDTPTSKDLPPDIDIEKIEAQQHEQKGGAHAVKRRRRRR